MTADDRDPERDQLSRVLERWEPPAVPDGLDERVMEAYRRRTGVAPSGWFRLLTGTIRVPVPVALLVAILLLVTAALALRPSGSPPTATTPTETEPVQAAQGAAPLVTGISLAGFQPVSEVTATVVQEGTP